MERMTISRRIKALLGTAAVAAMVSPAIAQAQYFRSPSGNIRCVFASELPGVACQALNSAREVQLDRYGVATTSEGDGSPMRVGRVLPYGWTMTGYGVRCASLQTGMRCTAAGHGFLLARSGVRMF